MVMGSILWASRAERASGQILALLSCPLNAFNAFSHQIAQMTLYQCLAGVAFSLRAGWRTFGQIVGLFGKCSCMIKTESCSITVRYRSTGRISRVEQLLSILSMQVFGVLFLAMQSVKLGSLTVMRSFRSLALYR
jgi:hypothetical protein